MGHEQNELINFDGRLWMRHMCVFTMKSNYMSSLIKRMGLITFGFSILFNKTYDPYAACYV